MQRFYFPDLIIIQEIFILKDKDIFFQLTKVLRLKLGDEIIFFDGIKNIDYLFIMKTLSKKEILFSFIKEINKSSSYNNEINLLQALPNKLSKIEYILQKGVEVGLNSFTFFSSIRSQKLFLSENKLKRLKKIIIEATEQSNRNIIPQLSIVDSFSKINLGKNQENLFFHTSGENTYRLKDISFNSNKKINILVGPEGGWDNKELLEFETLKIRRVFLGNNILRTETVSLVTAFFLLNK